MKLIAKRDFVNIDKAITLADAKHPDHIHLGAIFTIGAKPETEFDQLSQREKSLVYQLNGADCIADGDDPKIVKRVQAIAAERESVTKRQAPALAPAK